MADIERLATRLNELSMAVSNQNWNEFSMRVPAEPQRDADIVLMDAATELIQLSSKLQDFQILFDFHGRHGLPPKMRPSCLVCGRNDYEGEPAIKHMELPGIVVCAPCHSAVPKLHTARTALEDIRDNTDDLAGDPSKWSNSKARRALEALK